MSSMFSRIPSLAQLSDEHQSSGARLVCISQESPSQEVVVRRGAEKKVHVVVKGSSFLVQLGLVNNVLYNQVIDLRQFTVEAKLVYDTDEAGEHKEVDFVKVKPLEYKSKLNEQGSQITLECRLKVLTSQHEDMFFRIKVRLIDPSTGDTYSPSMVVITEPIKVISKPEQLKKRQPNRQRTLTDLIVDAVNRVEQEQVEQKTMLEKCLTAVRGGGSGSGSTLSNSGLLRSHSSALSSSTFAVGDTSTSDQDWRSSSLLFSANSDASLASLGSSMAMSQESGASGLMAMEEASMSMHAFGGSLLSASDKEGFESPGAHFEAAFRRFLLVYNTLSTEEKPAKIRKLVRNATTKEQERCAAFIDLFSSEGLQRAAAQTQSVQSRSGCACAVCPYQKELERIDDFYEGFLSAPFGQGGGDSLAMGGVMGMGMDSMGMDESHMGMGLGDKGDHLHG